ncbi:MAG: hypothetical protein Q8868_06470 [Bacteroidota bacterium]|nr:hypothetical protein [Bacteroidota bacterium]
MKRNTLIIAGIIALTGWQCSKNGNLSLKESLGESTGKINTAFEKIAGSKGYQLITVSDAGTKSDDSYGFRDSINLKLIAGVYDFKPGMETTRHFNFPYRLFEKTGTSDNLIINLPEKLVFHPRHLHFYNATDTALKNNFTITASDYHFYYTWWNNCDYKLDAEFTLDKEDIGSIDVFSAWQSGTAGKYSRSFTFQEGYSFGQSGQTGDTTMIVFELAQKNDTLLKESLMFTGDGFKKREKQYILSIGNVNIKKATGIDSLQVFLSGVLQKTAAAKIVDTTDTNGSICDRRDILLTFDDGTTSKLSDLISPSREILRSLSRSLGEMYLSQYIVDYIAFSIYYNNH